jgi:TolA-binding protein
LKISQELSELNKVETEENVRFNSVAEKLHPKLKLNKMDTQEECDLVINQSQVEIDKIASEIESMQQEFERLENELK